MDEKDLEPEIIAMGTCRMLRIRKIGAIYFVENLHLLRSLGPDNKEIVTEDWKAVAVAKGKDARMEAFEWMHNANIQALEMSNNRGHAPLITSNTRKNK